MILVDGQMDDWLGWMHNRWMDIWLDGWMSGEMDGCVDEWMDDIW